MCTTKFLKLTFSIAIVIFSCSIITAQVKIKERVEISPTKNSINGKLPIKKDISINPPGSMSIDDFALDGGGGFVNYFDEDIFVPRIGGKIALAYDHRYLRGSGMPIWQNSLYVYGLSGSNPKIYPFIDFGWNEKGEFNPYAFSQEKFERDTAIANYWKELEPCHCYMEDTTMWGYYPVDRIFLSVKAWEPLRFRYYYFLSPDEEGLYGSPKNDYEYATFTEYPSDNGIGTGHILFPTFGTGPGEFFNMTWVSRDSSAVGAIPPIYLDQQPEEFYLPDSGMYRVIIGNVKPNVNGTLSVIDTTSHILVENIRSHQGDTILVGPYSEGTVLKFDLSGMVQCGGQGEYLSGAIGFENWIDYDFQDATIWFEYAAGRPDHLELWSTSETIYYGDTLDVEIVPCDADSLFSPLGKDYNYEFSVELVDSTSKYVELIYDGQASNIVEHIPSYDRRGTDIRLAANKEEPDSVVALTFRLKAYYIGSVGPASSVQSAPTSQADIKVLSKKSSINIDKQILGYKDGKITLSFGKEKRTVDRFTKKKLQTLSASRQPRMKKIGHMLKTDKTVQKSSASLSKNGIRALKMDEGTDDATLENDWIIGINPPQEILLGEDIYFQAVADPIPTHGENLIIIPFKKMSEKHEPYLTGAKFSVSRMKGDNFGVYYDDKIDSNGLDLEAGIIRLVGRYWKPGNGNEYIVKLEASALGRSGHMYVQVKKPEVLGNPNLTDDARHTRVKDVKGDTCWLDEWIIKYAGEYGIFPQIIKAQIQCESNFKPAYRWEPFKDSDEQNEGNFDDSRYKITVDPLSEGNPPIPWQDHKNAKPIYPHGEYITIWDRLYNNSTWLNPIASSGIYDGKRSNGDYIWSIKDADVWENKFIEAMSDIMNSVDDARSIANKWLHDKYTKMDETAQTRIAASYGFLQMTYTTAVYERGYHKDIDATCDKHLPEYLNETENDFNYAVPYLAKKLSNVIKDFSNKDGNWPLGYEAKIKIALNSYNGRVYRNSYGKNVLNVRNIYYPNLNNPK